MKIRFSVWVVAFLSAKFVFAIPTPQVPLLTYSPRQPVELAPDLMKLKQFGESLKSGSPQLTVEEHAHLMDLLEHGFLNLKIESSVSEDRRLKLQIAAALFPDINQVVTPEQLIYVPPGVSLRARINAFLQTRHLATPEMDDFLFECVRKAMADGFPGLRMGVGYWDWRTPQGFITTAAHFQHLLDIEGSVSVKKIEIVSIMEFTQRAFRQAYPLYLKPTAESPLSIYDVLARGKRLMAAEIAKGGQIPATTDWLRLHRNHRDAFYLYFESLKFLERLNSQASPFTWHEPNMALVGSFESMAQLWEAISELKITKESDRKAIQEWLLAPRRTEEEIAPVLHFMPEIFSYAEVTLPAKYLAWMRRQWQNQITIIEGAAWKSFDLENPEKKTYSLRSVDTQREEKRKEFVLSRSREVKERWIEVVFDSLDQLTVHLDNAKSDQDLTESQAYFWDGISLVEDLTRGSRLRDVLAALLAFQVQFRKKSNAIGGTQMMWEQTRAMTQWISSHQVPKEKSLIESYFLNLQKKNGEVILARESKWIGILSGINHWRIGVNDELPDLDVQELDVARLLFTRQRSRQELSCASSLLRPRENL